MAKSRESIDAAIREYAARERRVISGHPEAEDLAAYHRNELAEEERDKIRSHLAICEECSQLVLDLADFADLPPPSEEFRLSDAMIEEQKEALRERLSKEEEPAAKLLPFSKRPESSAKRPPRPHILGWYHLLAASLFGACVGLSLGIAIRAPAVVNPVIENLVPIDEEFRNSSAEPPLRYSPERHLLLVLSLFKEVDYPAYRLEILDGERNLLRSNDHLKPEEEGHFHFIFPWKLRSEGTFVLRLYGLTENGAEPLAEYHLPLIADMNR